MDVAPPGAADLSALVDVDVGTVGEGTELAAAVVGLGADIEGVVGRDVDDRAEECGSGSVGCCCPEEEHKGLNKSFHDFTLIVGVGTSVP